MQSSCAGSIHASKAQLSNELTIWPRRLRGGTGHDEQSEPFWNRLSLTAADG
jgi:hypothetical protein